MIKLTKYTFIIISIFAIIPMVCMCHGKDNKQGNEIMIGRHRFEALESEEIDEFIKDKDISPLNIELLYDFITVIIYQNHNIRGYYEVYKRDGMVIQGRKVSGKITDDRSYDMFTLSGGTNSGDYPFTVLYIEDESITGQGYYFMLKGEKGMVKRELVKRAYAIETVNIGGFREIYLYDHTGGLIYHKK